MDKEKWSTYAKAEEGSTVVWINQSSNKDLKEVGSKGVCFAITHDWIKKYRLNKVARSTFVNAFRNAAIEDPDAGIPLEYVIEQEELASKLLQRQRALKKLMLEEAKKGAVVADVKEAILKMNRDLYGPGLVQLTTYPNDGTTSLTTVLNDMENVATKSAAYFMLSLKRKGGGHVVGFEFRPDIHVSEEFPGLFEFIDANLGLYAFPRSDNVVEFFRNYPWNLIYKSKGYTSFELAQFDLGQGGFGKA